jgi:hypothetical protein
LWRFATRSPSEQPDFPRNRPPAIGHHTIANADVYNQKPHPQPVTHPSPNAAKLAKLSKMLRGTASSDAFFDAISLQMAPLTCQKA